MEELILKLLKEPNGWIVVLGYLALKYGNILVKKSQGKYVSCKETQEKLDALDSKVNLHLKESEMNVVKLEKLESSQIQINANLEKENERLRESIIKIFDNMDKLKDILLNKK